MTPSSFSQLIVANAPDPRTTLCAVPLSALYHSLRRYVEMDPNLPLTLLDQKHSGKKLALITNS
eukprot:944992-Rhodomonas_salina.1